MLTRMQTPIESSTTSGPRLAYSVAETEALTGLSRSSLYRLFAAGKLKAVKCGKRRLVLASALEDLFSGEPSTAEGSR